MRLSLFALVALGLPGLAGCRSLPTYGVLASFPHKDVLHLTVLLEQRGSVAEYRRIAKRELERFRELREPAEHPLYQVQVEFRSDSRPYELLAEVVAEIDSPPRHLAARRPPDPTSWRVVLFARSRH